MSKSKPRIGIVGWKTGENSFGTTLAYLQFINYFEATPVILAPSDKDTVDEDLDLLIIPGGPDVSPTRYGEVADFSTGKSCPFREHFDVINLSEYIGKVPIFGICRGIQTIAVHFGAKLIQNMYHETNPAHDRSKLVHSVWIEDNILDPVKGFRGIQEVNSIHHQTINKYESTELLKAVGFEITAKYAIVKGKKSESKVTSIEAIHNSKLNIAAVQWHPEEIYDEYSIALVENLLRKNK